MERNFIDVCGCIFYILISHSSLATVLITLAKRYHAIQVRDTPACGKSILQSLVVNILPRTRGESKILAVGIDA